MSALNSLKDRIILLPEAKMDYSPKQIKKFIELWENGAHFGDIAENLWISNYEVALLVMHCDLVGWIQPRPGGLVGSIPRVKRYQKKGEK